MNQNKGWDINLAKKLIDDHVDCDGPLTLILNKLQDTFGYIDKEAVTMVAQALNIGRAEVYGVVSFYHDYKEVPPKKRLLRICRAEACQANGCEDLVKHL